MRGFALSGATHFLVRKILKKIKNIMEGRFYTMKRIKKILSFAIATITTATAITAQAAQFTDLSPEHWAYDSVTKMAERGVFHGYEDGTFRPGQAMTHEEFVKTIVEYVAPYSVTPKGADYQQIVTDDPSNPQYWTNHWAAWAQPYLDKALELGLIGDGSDASNKKIATLLDDYDEIINGASVSGLYRDLDCMKIETGFDFNDAGNIAPNTLITREEAARLITRALYLTQDSHILYGNESKAFAYESGCNPISYKYASLAVGYNQSSVYVYDKYQPNALAGLVCNLDIYTGSTEGNGLWDVTPKYRRDVIVSVMNGITGTDENAMYNPHQALTRAEAAAIMLRLSDKNERLKSPISPSAILIMYPSARWDYITKSRS